MMSGSIDNWYVISFGSTDAKEDVSTTLSGWAAPNVTEKRHKKSCFLFVKLCVFVKRRVLVWDR